MSLAHIGKLYPLEPMHTMLRITANNAASTPTKINERKKKLKILAFQCIFKRKRTFLFKRAHSSVRILSQARQFSNSENKSNKHLSPAHQSNKLFPFGIVIFQRWFDPWNFQELWNYKPYHVRWNNVMVSGIGWRVRLKVVQILSPITNICISLDKFTSLPLSLFIWNGALL